MRHIRLAAYAWGVLAYNLAVILWGALVRATGSGAGCGGHWPLCNGQVIPLAPGLATTIEFTHRVMSGASLVLIAGLLAWALRELPRGHRGRFGAALSMVFIITEALIGAGLVLLRLVAGDESLARAVSISVHLTNTFLLLASLTLTAWWISGNQARRLRSRGATAWLLGGALLGTLVLGATGAVTALGDTLFPALSLAEGFRQDLSSTTAVLLRLRVLHPVLAALVGSYVLGVAWSVGARNRELATRRVGRIVLGLVLVQWVAGAANLLLLAPVWLQLIHLLLSDVIWISLVLLAATALSVGEGAGAEVPSIGQPAIG